MLGGHFFSEGFDSLTQYLRHHFFGDALVQQPVYPRRNLQMGQAQDLRVLLKRLLNLRRKLLF